MIGFGLTVLAGSFAIMNPILNTPIFMSLTEEFDRAKQKRIAAKSTITAFFIILVLPLFGKLIFTLFSLTLPAFRITGGILVFLVGFELICGKHSKTRMPMKEDSPDEEAHLRLALTPLATPILAGPGTVVTAANFVSEGSLVQDLITLCIHMFSVGIYGSVIEGMHYIAAHP